MMMDPSTMHAFIGALYSAVFEQGYHVVLLGIRGERPNAEIQPRRCSSVEKAVAAVEALSNEGYNVYYPTTLIPADCALAPSARGTEADVAALLGFHVDLDLRGPAHPKATIPDVASALAIIDVFEVPPSFIILTGHGVQAVWLFNEPLVIGNEAERCAAKLLVRRFVATIAVIARMKGGHYVDPTGDLARVLRMPGTTNRAIRNGQALPPVDTEVLRPEKGQFDGVSRYNPDDIEQFLVQVDDDVEIDYELVGAFEIRPAAAVPEVVNRLCRRSEAFALLWSHDHHAKVHDRTTSGYRYAIIGHLVRAGATDQEIVDAICAWYARHDRAYDKHIARPGLIAHEIAKQRSRHRNRHPKSEDASAMTAPPTLGGPNGIRLIAIESKPTPAKRRVRFEVYCEDQPAGEILATDAAGAAQKACDQLQTVISDARGDKGALAGQELDEVRKWLRSIVTARQLDRVAEDLAEYQRAREAVEDVVPKPTVHDITVNFMMESLGLAFREPGDLVWSEQRGQSMSRNDILNHFPQELLEQIKGASNYPKPTESNTTKPIHHLQLELKSVWTEISSRLPMETEAHELGPASKAAERLSRQIRRIWETPEVWSKAVNAGPEGRQIDRTSLVLRARELAATMEGRPRWIRIFRGADAFVRVERGRSDRSVIWLGMRATLCHGAIKGTKIPGIEGQHELRVLMDRYGLSDDGSVSDRLHRDDGQQRICVLSRQLTDHLIYGTDADDDEARVTNESDDFVTRDEDEPAAEEFCREVAHAR